MLVVADRPVKTQTSDFRNRVRIRITFYTLGGNNCDQIEAVKAICNGNKAGFQYLRGGNVCGHVVTSRVSDDHTNEISIV